MSKRTLALIAGKGWTNSSADYYTTPTGARTIIKKATFCNNDSIPGTVTINIGGAAAYGNQITKAKTLAAGETWSCPDVENQVMESGEIFSIVAGTSGKIGVRVSGIEVT